MDDSMKTKAAIAFLAIMVLGYYFSSKSDSTTYSKNGISITFPLGWEQTEEHPRNLVAFSSERSPEIITYASPEKDVLTEEPFAKISLYIQKLSAAVWIQDEFHTVLSIIVRSYHTIMDKGEIKVDGELSKWVVYTDPRQEYLNLEFFMVTSTNTLYKIHYKAKAEHFNRLRKEFETTKESFHFTGFRM